MAGHFSRVIYDDCAFCESVKISTNPGKYKLYGGQVEHHRPCAAPTGPRNNRTGVSSEVNLGNFAERAEIESLLTDRNYPISLCTKGRTLAEKNAKLQASSLLQDNPVCDLFLQPEDTRLTYPADTLKGIYIDRYEYPIRDPQSGVYYGSDPTTDRHRFGSSTRLFVRDNYRIKKLVPFNNGVVFPHENRAINPEVPDMNCCSANVQQNFAATLANIGAKKAAMAQAIEGFEPNAFSRYYKGKFI